MSPSIPFLALACVALASSAAALQVGHLNDATPSKTDWAAPILLAGEMPVHVTNIASHDLGSLQVLCVDIGTTGPSSALLARVPDLTAWVSAGGVLVYHDRSLSTTAFLPGGSSVTLSLGASGDVNVVTPGTLLTGGPGGQLDDSTLDSWTATTSGFATNLPGGAVNLLANGETPTHSTAFIYPHGAGSVYYSAIPVDFYLAGLGPAETAAAMSAIYAPNLVAYAVHGGGSPVVSFCGGDVSVCPCGNGGSSGRGCANSSSGSGAALSASGYASLGSSSLLFAATGLVPGQPGLLFQGESAVNGGAGAQFGDGLRCAGTQVVRLEVVNASAQGEAQSTVNIALAGGVVAGVSRTYQLWYRDPVGSPCGTGFNTTNGLQTTWVP